VAIIQNVEQTAQRLGGTAEAAVGEGRQDAPVGTTIALIEQAQKVMSAVHKRMHAAQAKEFQLLKDLFVRDPSALWRSNKNPKFKQDAYLLQQALENKNIVPRADPNTASQSLRIQKGIALYTLATQNPAAFDQKAVYKRLLSMLDIDDADDLFSKAPPGPPPVDETKMMDAKAKLMAAQAKMMDTSVKAQQAEGDMSLKMAQLQTQNIAEENKKQAIKIDAVNHAADRKGKLQLEALRLKQTQLVHADKLRHEETQNLLNRDAQQTLKGLDLEQARQQMAYDALTNPPKPEGAE
jgi:hypothetical protein